MDAKTDSDQTRYRPRIIRQSLKAMKSAEISCEV